MTGFAFFHVRKDGIPPASGHLASFLEECRTWHTDRLRWPALDREVNDALNRIGAGLNVLAAVVRDARSGTETLEAWTKAGYHQLWRARVARAVLDRVQDRDGAWDSDDAIRLLTDQKTDFRRWLERAQTPQIAARNSGLAFDCLVDFFQHR